MSVNTLPVGSFERTRIVVVFSSIYEERMTCPNVSEGGGGGHSLLNCVMKKGRLSLL